MLTCDKLVSLIIVLIFFACGFTFHKKLTVGPGKLQQNNNQVIKKRWLRDMSMCNVFHMKWRINNNVIYRKRLLHHVPIKFLTTYCKIHHVILFYGANLIYRSISIFHVKNKISMSIQFNASNYLSIKSIH
jgi:hypothetical protein